MPRALVVEVAFTTVALATLLGVLWYAASPPEPSYLMVDELVRDPARWQGRELKVHGWVLAGSIRPLVRDGGYTLLLLRNGPLRPRPRPHPTRGRRAAIQVTLSGAGRGGGRAGGRRARSGRW